MAITIQDSASADVDFVRESLQMQQAVTQRGRLRFSHIGTSAPLEWGEDVYVKDGATTIWGGTVEAITEKDITVGGTTTLLFTYDCVDFSQLASRKIIFSSSVVQNAGTTVTSLAGLLSEFGVSAGTIEDGAFIQSITFNGMQIEAALDELAELSSFYWDIDKDKNLNFRAIDSNVAPFDLTNSNQPYRNISFQRRRGNYTNVVWVRAGTTVSEDTTTETQKGDGSKRVFVVDQAIGTVPTISVDRGSGFSEETVGVNGIGTGSQWYYNIGSPVVVQDTGETLLGSTDEVKIEYQSRFPIIVKATNDEGRTERAAAETGGGDYERVVDALDVESLDEAQQRATSILEQYGSERLTVSYSTDTAGLEAGMSQLVNLTEHGINARFLIESLTMTLLEDGTQRYEVDAAATQTVAGWSYWKQKTRQDRKFVIRDNEVLDTLKEIKDNMTLSDAEPSASTTTASGFTVSSSSIVGLVDVG